MGKEGVPGMVTVDQFAVIFKLLFAVASTLTLLLAHRYFQAKHIARPEFAAPFFWAAFELVGESR